VAYGDACSFELDCNCYRRRCKLVSLATTEAGGDSNIDTCKHTATSPVSSAGSNFRNAEINAASNTGACRDAEGTPLANASRGNRHAATDA
jgi:hypothetical protein